MGQSYEQLGVRRAINASGTLTRVGGSLMDRAVLEAMSEAARSFVRIDELQAAVGVRIAAWTGTEAALVTSGASAALTLAAAACLAGTDHAAMDRLPHADGRPREIIIPRSHRNGYDHALRAAGAVLIEVGVAERSRDPQPWEIEATIGANTAAVAYCAGFSELSLDEVVQVAHDHELPVIVDAAATLPPKSNLTAFSAAGADLVCYSGGKGIRGPQSSGILCGRRELIASAALQMWDLDYVPELWDPPSELIDAEIVARGVPNHGIGRGLKVGKEEIVGLYVALERFMALDEAAAQNRLEAIAAWIVERLEPIAGLDVQLERDPAFGCKVQARVDPQLCGMTAVELVRKLSAGNPAVHVMQAEAPRGLIGIEPFCLAPGDEQIVVDRIAELLRR